MVLNHNLGAMNANRNLGQVSVQLGKTSEKLSSGYRINRAGDDAAGLTISEKMRSQIRGLKRASQNAEDGISFVQTTEGALNEIHSLLQRGRELCVQAANDTNQEADRAAIAQEIEALNKEVDRIAQNTEYNTMKVFHSGKETVNSAPLQKVKDMLLQHTCMVNVDITYESQDWSTAISQAAGAGKSFTQEGINKFTKQLKDTYLPSLLGSITSKLNFATPTMDNLQIGLKMTYENNSVLAYVSSNGTKYQLGVNLKYLTQNGDTIAMTEDLATTIAHEMTHAIMFDTTTNGMMGTGGADSFPMWFIEGTAQSIGGAIDYCQELTKTGMLADDGKIQNWLSKMTDTSDPYHAYAQGYIGTMYLGYVAGGGGTVSSDTIASGINKILSDVKNGYSLSEAIYKNTNGTYKTLQDFENKFPQDAVGFTKDLVAAIGTGTGSIVSPNGLSGDKNSLLNSGVTDDFFTLDEDSAYADNPYQQNGKNPYNGGGATQTGGLKQDGTQNTDASPVWNGPVDGGNTGGGTTGGTGGTGSGGSTGGTGSGGTGGAGSGGSTGGGSTGGTGGTGTGGSTGGTGTGGNPGGGNTGGNANGNGIYLQVGAQANQGIVVYQFELSTKELGLAQISVEDYEHAASAIASYDKAISDVSVIRSYYGAVQNRLEHTKANLDNIAENTQAAESRIRDADIATMMVAFSKYSILQQAGEAMLAQANQSKQGVLDLLQG